MEKKGLLIDEELISSFIDNELPTEKQKELEVNFENCCKSKDLKDRYEKIDQRFDSIFLKEGLNKDALKELDLPQEILDLVIEKSKKNNTYIKQRGIIVEFKKKNRTIHSEKMSSAAAGELSDIPSSIPVPSDFILDDVSLSIELNHNKKTDHLDIEFCGGDYYIRSAIKMQIFYKQGEPDIFDGKDIAIGGAWQIPWKKAKDINKIEFI